MDGWRAPSLGIHSAIDKGSMSAKKRDGAAAAAVNYKLTCLPSHRPTAGCTAISRNATKSAAVDDDDDDDD